MISGLYRLIVAAADWRPRYTLVGIAIAAIVAVFATVSVGFGLVAAYLHFESTSGPVVASLVISAAYAAAATAGYAASCFGVGDRCGGCAGPGADGAT